MWLKIKLNRVKNDHFHLSEMKRTLITIRMQSSYHYDPSMWKVSSADGSLTTGMSGSVNICKPSKSIGPNPARMASSVKKSESKEPHMFDIALPKSLAKSCRKIGSSPPGA